MKQSLDVFIPCTELYKWNNKEGVFEYAYYEAQRILSLLDDWEYKNSANQVVENYDYYVKHWQEIWEQIWVSFDINAPYIQDELKWHRINAVRDYVQFCGWDNTIRYWKKYWIDFVSDHVLWTISFAHRIFQKLKNKGIINSNEICDEELVHLAAALHDSGSPIDWRENHHFPWQIVANYILNRLWIPEDRITAVEYAIFHHRGSLRANRKTILSKIVADADTLDNPMCISWVFKEYFCNQKLSLEATIKAIYDKYIGKQEQLHFDFNQTIMETKMNALKFLMDEHNLAEYFYDYYNNNPESKQNTAWLELTNYNLRNKFNITWVEKACKEIFGHYMPECFTDFAIYSTEMYWSEEEFKEDIDDVEMVFNKF